MTQKEPETTRETILDCLDRLERAFRKRWENDEKFRSSLEGKDRDILIDLRAEGAWTLKVRNGDLVSIDEGKPKDPDVKIDAEAEDFVAVFNGDLSPLEAYVKRRIKVKAGFRDILLVKSFMGG